MSAVLVAGVLQSVSPECGGSDLELTLALLVYTYSMHEAERVK